MVRQEISIWVILAILGYNTRKVQGKERDCLGFIQLVLLEELLLISSGMIFFGGIWGTVAATVVLSGINYFSHDLALFWRWEIPLLLGGMAGMLLLLVVGRIANKSKVITSLAGGLIGLVIFGAFVTPVLAIILAALVFGTGIVPKNEKSHVLWSFAPMIVLRDEGGPHLL